MARSSRKDSARKGKKRDPVTAERIVEAAIAIADARGTAAVTMRAVADTLGVQAMSLYNHVANKDAILDRMVDAVFARIEVPDDTDWQTAMRVRAHMMYEELKSHPWATALLDSRRTAGATTLQHHDHTIGLLREAGFSAAMVAHVIALLDSYVYGFAVQESSLPVQPEEDVSELARELIDSYSTDDLPNITWLATSQVLNADYSFSAEFEYGLNLLLEAVARRVEPGSGSTGDS